MILPRTVLVKRCSKDHLLLTKLSAIVLSAISLAISRHSQIITMSSSHRINNQISFFTAVILEMIEETKAISDQQLRTMFPYVLGGINGKFPSSELDSFDKISSSVEQPWQQSSCMIVSQISRYIELSKSLLQTLIRSITKAIRAKIDPEATGFITQEKEFQDVNLQSSVEHILMVVTVLMQYQKIKLTGTMLRELFLDLYPPYSVCDIVLQCLNGLRSR
jgi:hypothetical protein